MIRKNVIWVFVPLFLVSITSQSSVQARGQAQGRGQAVAAPGRPAPGNMRGDYTFIPKADLEALMGPTRGDRPARVVGIGGANLGAYILHYPAMKSATLNSFYHSEISELYYVIRGEGTALLGGELENPRWGDPNSTGTKEVTGPTVNGTMKGYTTQKWSAGDVIIVPAGVPHMIGYEVTVPNDILRVVFDPNKSIKAVPDREASMARLHAEGQQPQAQSPPVPRKPAPGPVTSFYHSEIAELYYVVRGSGTAMMGGELESATWDDSNSASIRQVRGPSVNGTMKNAHAQKFTAGDIFIVTPGVPHSVTYQVDERTDIIRAVIDPKGTL